MSAPCNHDWSDVVTRERAAGLCALCLAAELVELRERVSGDGYSMALATRLRELGDRLGDPLGHEAAYEIERLCGCGL